MTCHCWCAVLPGCWCCRPLVWAGPAGHPFSPFVRLPMCGWDRCCPAAPCCGPVTAAPAAGAAASLLWRRRPLGAGWAGPLATAGVLLHTPGYHGPVGQSATAPCCVPAAVAGHWSPLLATGHEEPPLHREGEARTPTGPHIMGPHLLLLPPAAGCAVYRAPTGATGCPSRREVPHVHTPQCCNGPETAASSQNCSQQPPQNELETHPQKFPPKAPKSVPKRGPFGTFLGPKVCQTGPFLAHFLGCKGLTKKGSISCLGTPQTYC